MLIINFINYEYKSTTETYIFILFIYNKSFITSNIAVFKDFNIIKISFDRPNS